MVSVFSFYTFRTMRAWQLVFELNILLELQEHNDYCLMLFEPWLHVISILICLYSCQNNESKCGHQFLEFFYCQNHGSVVVCGLRFLYYQNCGRIMVSILSLFYCRIRALGKWQLVFLYVLTIIRTVHVLLMPTAVYAVVKTMEE